MACSQQGFTFNLPCEVAIARYSPSKLGSTLAYSQLFDSAVLFNITFADGKPRSNVKNYSKKQLANTSVRSLLRRRSTN